MNNTLSPSPREKILNLVETVRLAAEADSPQNPAAHAKLLTAIRKLQIAAETPMESILRLLFLPQQDAALEVAIDMGLLEFIVANGGKFINASELSEKSGGATLLIVRIMRVLTAIGICEEVAEDTYLSNDLAIAITEGGKDGFHHLFDMAFPTAAKLPDYLHSVGYKNPENPVASPFAYIFGAPVFEWIKQNPAEQAVFNAYMAARRKGRPSWFDIFPVEESLGPEWLGGNADAVLLVDVGGNCGQDLIKFEERYPGIPGRLILEDLPQVVADLHLNHKRIEPIAYDFCTPQPVKGARFYYFRAIFHDWPDHTCRKILENTIPAMVKGHSKLIISEFVLPNIGVPLLPCLLDIQMMGLQAGRERTEKEWRALLDSVGLVIVKIWTIEPGTESVIEAEVKD